MVKSLALATPVYDITKGTFDDVMTIPDARFLNYR
jgi:hypothetical protein